MKPSEIFIKLFELMDLPKGYPQAVVSELAQEFKKSGLELDNKDIPDEQAAQIIAEARADPEKLKRWFTERHQEPLTPDQFMTMQKETERIAAKAFINLNGPHPQRASIDKKHLHAIATGTYAHSYAIYDDDEEAAGELGRWTATRPDPSLRYQFMTKDGRAFLMACARWADQAFPVVQLHGHKYAAALMSTNSRNVDIRPPWKSFLLEVPSGLLWTRESADAEPSALRNILVFTVMALNLDTGTRELAWNLAACTADGMILWRINKTLAALQAEDLGPEDERHAMNMDLLQEDERALFLITRLALNTCLAMSDPDNVRAIGKHPAGWTHGPGTRTDDEPLMRRFRVGKPVEVDCRKAVTDYMLGKARGPISVQFLVRGHWRNQPCGPGLSERKVIWIAPFWKGPADGPINVRPHVLRNDIA